MKRKQFTEEQIIGTLKQAEAGARAQRPGAGLCQMAISHDKDMVAINLNEADQGADESS